MKVSLLVVLYLVVMSTSIAFGEDHSESVPKNLSLQLHTLTKRIDGFLLTYIVKSTLQNNPDAVREMFPTISQVFEHTQTESELQVGLYSDTLVIRHRELSRKIITESKQVINENRSELTKYDVFSYYGAKYAIVSRSPTSHFVYKCDKPCAYLRPVYPFSPVDSIDLVFLAGIDPTSLDDYKVERVEDLGEQWIIYGSGSPSIRWKIHFRKSDGLPTFCEFGRPTFTKIVKVSKTTRLRGQAFPAEVTIEEITRNSKTGQIFSRYVCKYTLKSKDNYNGEIEIPLGTSIADYRLMDYADFVKLYSSTQLGGGEQAVIYPWSGRLLSEAELQQLAYQQGHLIPPDAPARRYSLWMFLPAVILFGLAGYLYYRQKRK